MSVSSDKKVPLVLAYAFAMFAVVFVAACFAHYLIGGVECIVSAVSLMCIAIPFHIFGKRVRAGYYVAFALNALSTGLAVSSYYIIKEISLGLTEILPPALLAFAALALAGLTIHLVPKAQKAVLITALAVMLVLLAFAVVDWVNTDAVFYSYGSFSLVISLIWLGVIRLIVGRKNRNVLRDISFGSFGVATAVATIVITIITEDSAALEIGLESIENNAVTTKKKK